MIPPGLFPILVTVFLLMNLFTLLVFGYDKRQARRDNRRVPERTLLVLSLAGPFGALIGMYMFKHKTGKLKFSLLVPVFAFVQLVVFFRLLMQ